MTLNSKVSAMPVPTQAQIIEALGVQQFFDPMGQIERRVAFLADYLAAAHCRAYVLGISGGVDSLVAGRLAQLAVERTRNLGGIAEFLAVRLPYGQQSDEDAAMRAMDFIRPDTRITVNIKPAVDAQRKALSDAGLQYRDAAHEDFISGNIKARQRMITQYALAGTHGGLVIGTDHAAEALMGFFTKFGDGAADVIPLHGLNKRRVRQLGQAMDAPRDLVMKVPTADLESLAPMRSDEDAFGITYEQIDDFLEGKPVAPDVLSILLTVFQATAHKRALPVGPSQDTRNV
jgi:NAD+ synthase